MPEDTVPTTVKNALALTLEPSVEDDTTGARWVHKDYVAVKEAWSDEKHQSPATDKLHFGDVESWISYVKDHGHPLITLATWNTNGLRAVLNHHVRAGEPEAVEAFKDHVANSEWIAYMPFKLDPSFEAWAQVCNSQSVPHTKMIEFLEDHFDEILSPDHAELIELLRALRGNYKASGETTLNADGTSRVQFNRETGVSGAGGGEVTLPQTFEVRLPILRGWLETETNVDEGKAEGEPVRYKLVVRLRVSVALDGHVEFRLAMPQRDRVLAQVYGEVTDMVKAELADDYPLLRTTDGAN